MSDVGQLSQNYHSTTSDTHHSEIVDPSETLNRSEFNTISNKLQHIMEAVESLQMEVNDIKSKVGDLHCRFEHGQNAMIEQDASKHNFLRLAT